MRVVTTGMPDLAASLFSFFHRTGGEDAAPRHNQGTLGLFSAAAARVICRALPTTVGL